MEGRKRADNVEDEEHRTMLVKTKDNIITYSKQLEAKKQSGLREGSIRLEAAGTPIGEVRGATGTVRRPRLPRRRP
jgi:hypothetical protein